MATTAGLTDAEKKIPGHSKYITTPTFNKLTAENFAARLAQANLASKNHMANFDKKKDFDDKLKYLGKKLFQIKQNLYLLKMNSFKKITFGLSLFIGKSCFNNDGAELYLIPQPLYYTLRRRDDTEKVVSWKSKGLPTEKLTTLTTDDNSFPPSIKRYRNSSICLIFKGSCLKQKMPLLFLHI